MADLPRKERRWDIERKYGLPSDCLRVHKPGSTDNYRRDVKIARIRRDYEA